MLLYTSSAGRLGMLLFARVKKAIFSLKAQQREVGGLPWRRNRSARSRTGDGALT